MKKKILPLLLSFSIASTLVIPYAYAASATEKIDQQLKQLDKLKAEAQRKAKEAESQISQVQDQKEQASKDKETIMKQLDEASKKLSDLNNQIDDVTGELQINAKQLDDAEARVESRDQMLKSRLRLMYMNGFVSYMDVLLSATSFSDFLTRVEALKSIVSQDKQILEANQKDRDTVAQKKVETEQQLEEVKQLYAEADAARQDLQAKEKQKEVMIASLSKKEQELEDITEESEDTVMKLAAQESKLQAQKRAAAAQAASSKSGQQKSPFTFSGGKFGYPLAIQGTLTSDFVSRINPVTGKQENHKGIDLAAPKGTEIRAAENGQVILAGWYSGYGNCVIIDHGSGVWTVYGHIRNDGIFVKKGDVVKRGQKIAEVGATGQATGNHLHFEVRVNQVPKDPKPYLR